MVALPLEGVVDHFSFSIARASALLALRPLPSAWAATLGLPRALVSNPSSPLTPQWISPQWISISLTKKICFLIPLPSSLAPS